MLIRCILIYVTQKPWTLLETTSKYHFWQCQLSVQCNCFSWFSISSYYRLHRQHLHHILSLDKWRTRCPNRSLVIWGYRWRIRNMHLGQVLHNCHTLLEWGRKDKEDNLFQWQRRNNRLFSKNKYFRPGLYLRSNCRK